MESSVSGVGVLDKTVAILDALAESPRALADLAARTRLPRATAYRLAVALEAHGWVGRDELGRFRLESRLIELGRAAKRERPNLTEVAEPALRALRDTTGESVQLYVRQGDRRICVASLESPHSLRTIVGVGASLPLEKGSAGRVLGGQPDELAQGWVQTVEEREPGVASVSAPVYVDGALVAAVSVSGPLQRTSRSPGRRYGDAVVDTARAIERALS